MIPVSCLRFAIYSCIYTAYASGQPDCTGLAAQSGAFPAAPGLDFQRSSEAHPSPLDFSASGVSLCSRGTASQTTCSGRRCQGRFYGQASKNIGAPASVAGAAYRMVFKRVGESCSGGAIGTETRAWLNGAARHCASFSWNIHLIVCYRPNWNRRTSCWFPIELAPWAQHIPLRRT